MTRRKAIVQNGFKLFFGDEMYHGASQLLFQAADDWCGQHDVTDGAETDDQYFGACQ